MKLLEQPSQEIVRASLSYNADDGTFIWLKPGNISYCGKPAGFFDKRSGYVRIKLMPFGAFGAHRLAWIHFYGNYDEKLCLDHIDGNRRNNAIANLRLATSSQNQMNSKPRSRSGVKGVERLASGNYRARIYPFGPGGGAVELGVFPTLEQAAAARKEASEKHFGQFSREAVPGGFQVEEPDYVPHPLTEGENERAAT